MGTRGYVVYRYRNIYVAFRHRFDSYPSHLGIKVISSMRKPGVITILKQRLAETQDELSDILYPEESFQSGVDPRVIDLIGVMVLLQPDAITTLKHRLVEALDEFKDIVYPALQSCNDSVSWTRPAYWRGVFDASWIYEIDLDRNIFHINDIPYFRLDCLPNDENFLNYTRSKDHYGNRACNCPPCHKYEKPAPPNVTDSELATYRSLVCAGSHVTLSELLVASDILSPIEQVRVSLLETIIGRFMGTERYISPIIRQIELAPNHNQLTDDEWFIACSMANVAFIPQIFDTRGNINDPQRSRAEFVWVREDTVLCISTHLEDERCLQASMSRLINAISEQKNTPGDYFGVAFSVYHCAIIKVVKGEHATTFSHTDTLQFLPSFFGDSPSTPGMVALARLAYRVDPAYFARTLQIYNRQPMLHKWSVYNKAPLTLGVNDTTPSPALPAEIWLETALHLHLHDILTLGLVSRLCRQTALAILRHPHICGFRLVAMPKERAHCPLRRHGFLKASIYSAVQADVPACVVVGSHWKKVRERRKEHEEDPMVYIEVARYRHGRLVVSLPFTAERMAFVDEKCLCGDIKHHRLR